MEKYKLINQTIPKKNHFRVLLKVDMNDGDYVTTDVSYTKKEFNNFVIDDLQILKNRCSERHGLESFFEILEEEYDRSESELYIPYNDYGNIAHTLKSIEVTYKDENGVVYEVEIL